MTCVSQRDKGMCSSRIAWVRAGSRLFGRDIECVWERSVRARERDRERERELAMERERGREGGERGRLCAEVAYRSGDNVDVVRKWPMYIDAREASHRVCDSDFMRDLE